MILRYLALITHNTATEKPDQHSKRGRTLGICTSECIWVYPIAFLTPSEPSSLLDSVPRSAFNITLAAFEPSWWWRTWHTISHTPGSRGLSAARDSTHNDDGCKGKADSWKLTSIILLMFLLFHVDTLTVSLCQPPLLHEAQRRLASHHVLITRHIPSLLRVPTSSATPAECS